MKEEILKIFKENSHNANKGRSDVALYILDEVTLDKLEAFIEEKEKLAFEAGREESYYNNGMFTSDWYYIYKTYEDYKNDK